ncbi:MAG TPA: HD domain-containing protein [Phenylobacterium sp.]|jgi:phosphonate degradation associated HDIG domain protein|uniref:HD domain-containing protein n=1 Tax=Phenylobacterium sp. TaxID=1871053 RepID=UPI002D490659|nr:HD domain-containing protein [Phenylobacterium sp.]HZZ70354.1 HD domain-containing protein [Phenylobacterium sp.]
MRLRLEDIERLYAERGGRAYGEGVSQIEHALQCASLAQASGAPDSLIAAALLHDIGHILEDEGAVEAGVDARHELAGARALAGLFGSAVRRPIALHVAAKRWLCHTEAGYRAALSAASRLSLAAQGGPFDAFEAAAFERRPGWREAVTLRRLDDLGKNPQPSGRSFTDYIPILHRLAAANAIP